MLLVIALIISHLTVSIFFHTIMCKIMWTLHVKVWTLASLYEKFYFYLHECKSIITRGF